MVVKTREIIEAASIICDNHNIRVTVKSSMMAGGMVGLSTFAGAVVSKSSIKWWNIWWLHNWQLMGPPGILIGATAGGLYSYSRYRGTFKSAAVIIRDELTEDQKEQFVAHLVEAFSEFSTEDAIAFTAILMTNQTLVVSKITQFLMSEMGMRIID